VELASEGQLNAASLNDKIENISTIEQLVSFWSEINCYERALIVHNLAHDHKSLLAFIETNQK
jgi:hypothetical protein